MQGSRSGAMMAVAWGTLLHMGKSGYMASARLLHSIHQDVVKAVEKTAGVHHLCESNLAIVPIAADKGSSLDIFTVASELEKKGWNMFTAQNPPTMSVCIGARFCGDLQAAWVKDLQETVAYCLANPGLKTEGDAAVYGAAKALPDNILQDVLRSYCDIKMTVKHVEA